MLFGNIAPIVKIGHLGTGGFDNMGFPLKIKKNKRKKKNKNQKKKYLYKNKQEERKAKTTTKILFNILFISHKSVSSQKLAHN